MRLLSRLLRVNLENEMETVFEAYLPNGNVIRVFSDGSGDGLPEGTRVINHFVRRYVLCQALLKKCIDAKLISDHEASSLLT